MPLGSQPILVSTWMPLVSTKIAAAMRTRRPGATAMSLGAPVSALM